MRDEHLGAALVREIGGKTQHVWALRSKIDRTCQFLNRPMVLRNFLMGVGPNWNRQIVKHSRSNGSEKNGAEAPTAGIMMRSASYGMRPLLDQLQRNCNLDGDGNILLCEMSIRKTLKTLFRFA